MGMHTYVCVHVCLGRHGRMYSHAHTCMQWCTCPASVNVRWSIYMSVCAHVWCV